MATRVITLLLTSFAFFSISNIVLAKQSLHPSEFVLDNGLQILVKEDHRAPVAIVQLWYKVGSSYEHGGITGVSHVLEHMMFKGTPSYPNDSFSKIITTSGGNLNAFTNADYTAYYEELSTEHIETAFKLEADRMQNLEFTKEQFEQEMRVVKEERRLRTDDNPEAKLYERFEAAAFVSSPYHNPVIGWMNDLDNMTLEDAKHWYQQWYAPNNATLVVVGNVDPQVIYNLAKTYFGPLKSMPIAKVKQQQEIPNLGSRRINIKLPAKVPTVILGYNVPVVNTAEQSYEPYALDVIIGVLYGGHSSRFSRELIRGTSIASNLGAGYSPFDRMDTVLHIAGSPSQGHSVAELEQALSKQISRLHTELVSKQELATVKAQVIAHATYENDSISHIASLLGKLHSVGLTWQLERDYPDNIKAITAKQIQQVAKKYLHEDRLTVATLTPISTAATGVNNNGQ